MPLNTFNFHHHRIFHDKVDPVITNLFPFVGEWYRHLSLILKPLETQLDT